MTGGEGSRTGTGQDMFMTALAGLFRQRMEKAGAGAMNMTLWEISQGAFIRTVPEPQRRSIHTAGAEI